MTHSLALSATDNVFCPQPAPRYVIDVTLIICYESEKSLQTRRRNAFVCKLLMNIFEF